ncbi:MIP/aquaporin family protein [Alkalicoccus daliensis]|uniref:Glycerol uptake facilitator protein n=1 Tax=Alkalicoccus daliensis TaxID=745820 RepID=A0A1H0I7Z9_9BACI|nr:MIP/aquaporin family protein [Alkalicoccus daliensis]SDO27584.1 glycerol uptake facilitator protein [Alkalicoccus daliensis]
MSPFWGELIGTMILIIFGAGVVAGVALKDSKASAGGWIVITAGWGLGVALAVYAVGDISGAHINPAVTVGLATIGEFAWASVPGYIAAQIIGAMIGASLIYFMYSAHFNATEDPGPKLAVFSTSPAIRHTPSNFFSETLGTFVLVLGILFIGANAFTEGLNPLIVGLLIVAIGLSLGGTTGYAINPARDFGPRLVHALMPIKGKGSSEWWYAWIPIAGPILGGGLGALFYAAVFEGVVHNLLWIFLALFAATQVLTFSLEKKHIKTHSDKQVFHNPQEKKA